MTDSAEECDKKKPVHLFSRYKRLLLQQNQIMCRRIYNDLTNDNIFDYTLIDIVDGYTLPQAVPIVLTNISDRILK